MPKRLTALLTAAVCVLLTSCGTPAGKAPPDPAFVAPVTALLPFAGEYEPSAAPAGMEFVAKKGFTAMFADFETGRFAVEDMRIRKMYYSVPPDADSDTLAVGIHWSALRSELWVTDVSEEENSAAVRYSIDECTDSPDGFVKVKKTDNGILVGYRFGEGKYDIAVSYTLCEDGFRAVLLTDKIEEKGERKIYSITLLPNFGAARGTEGFLLLPDGSGSTVRFGTAKSTYSEYYAPLYGNPYLTSPDYVTGTAEPCMLPVVGIQHARGGVLALAENGDAFAAVNASAAGQGSEYYRARFSFDLRHRQEALIGNTSAFTTKTVTVYEKGPIKTGRVSVRYCFLDSDPDNGLIQMADATRAYLQSRTESEVLQIPAASMYFSVLGGYRKKKSVLGFLREVTEPVATFRDTEEMAKALKEAGARDLALIYAGYDAETLRGGVGAEIRPDSALGSKADLRALSDYLGDGRLLLTVQNVFFAEKAGGLSSARAGVRDLSLNRYTVKTYAKHTFFEDKTLPRKYLATPSLAAGLFSSLGDSLRRDYPNALLLAADYGNTLYSDFKTQNGFTRAQTAALISETFRKAAEDRPAAAEKPSFPALPYVSTVVNVPSESAGYDLTDESVPFYQAVLSSYKPAVSEPLNRSGSPRDEFLNCVRTGTIPHFELVPGSDDVLKESRTDSFYAAAFDDWAETVTQCYAEYRPLYERIAGKRMSGYDVLAPGVTRTEYENGVFAVVNRTAEPFRFEGTEIPAKSFRVFGPNNP